MMLAAPELVIAERIELLDEIEIPAELQHRMLADRVMRREEGSEFEACHGFSLQTAVIVDWPARQATCCKAPRQSPKTLLGHVVPANAGTHNPGRSYPQRDAATASLYAP